MKLITQEIHSKLNTMAFPDFDEVVTIVQETSKGAEPTTASSILARYLIHTTHLMYE